MGVVVCYCISTLVLEPPLEFFLPTISELGDRPPSSCIFTFCLSVTAVTFLWVCYVRYRDLQAVVLLDRRTNLAMFVSGLCFVFGMLIVASFQSSEVPVVHYAGATLLFVAATVYVWLNVVMSLKLNIWRKASIHVMRARVILAVLQTVAFMGVVAFGVTWRVLEVNGNLFWWRYVAVCEYILALSFGASFVSLFPDLNTLSVTFTVEEVQDVTDEGRSLNNHDSVKLIT